MQKSRNRILVALAFLFIVPFMVGQDQAEASVAGQGVGSYAVESHSLKSEDSGNRNKATIVRGVNFRTGPSTSYKSYGLLSKGTSVTILEQVNSNWLKVEAQGKQGYISSSSRYVDYQAGGAPTTKPDQGSSSLGNKIIKAGEKYLGTPYRFGAKAGSGYFDCSLFTQTVFKQHGISLPRSSRQQAQVGTSVKWGDWKVGDLLFFSTRATGKGNIGHVAIYAGNGKILHTWGKPGVEYSDVNAWKSTYIKSKRVIK